VLFHVEHRGIQIGGIELVRHGETDGSELSSLLDNGMQEADGKGEGSPLFIRLDLLNEILRDHGVEGSVKTSLHSLWWLHSDLDGHLEETEREVLVGSTSNPETEFFVNFDVLGVEDVLHISHELEGQMAIVENNPVTGLESVLDLGKSGAFHFFSHGGLLCGELLELSSVVIDTRGGISTSRKEIQDRLVGKSRSVDILNHIIDGSTELGVNAHGDELVGGDLSSIFTEGSHEAELQEGSEDLVSVNLVIIVGHGLTFWVIRVEECSPLGTTTSHGINKTLVEHVAVLTELVFGERNDIVPGLLIEPVELLVSVIDSSSSLKEERHIRTE